MGCGTSRKGMMKWIGIFNIPASMVEKRRRELTAQGRTVKDGWSGVLWYRANAPRKRWSRLFIYAIILFLLMFVLVWLLFGNS